MARYLLTISLGPVQSLIGAARRTRDLWCGSWLLNEAAKAAAKVLHQAQPGSLIFPCPASPDELEPQASLRDDDANIANIVRAEIDLADDAAACTLCDQASQAASARLAALCDEAKNKLARLPFHESLWAAQKSDILETFAAWVRVGSGDAAYAEASARLGSLLAARKLTRNFLPAATTAAGPGHGIPKSSLDGARESVIKLSRAERKGGAYKLALRRLGIGNGEELDALAVTKRMAGNIDQFTAYSRIAADPWLETLDAQDLQKLCAAYAPLIGFELATGTRGNRNIYGKLPYDGQLLFRFRLENALAAPELEPDERHALDALRQTLHKIDGEPVPYAVILKADGDRMGELLSRADNAEASRCISRHLHEFAQSVRGIVCKHRGHAIYAGGDDVLAMLPLESAVQCARELAETFKEKMAQAAQALSQTLAEEQCPTLSVGLAIGHLLEPLGALRARADVAEALAKGDGQKNPRNALAIRLGIRSGGELVWRGRWDDASGLDALERFKKEYQNRQCPSRLGYDLRAISGLLGWVDCSASPLPGIHQAELERTLAHARERGGENMLSPELKAFLIERAGAIGLARLADELIITRWLAARTRADIGVLE